MRRVVLVLVLALAATDDRARGEDQRDERILISPGVRAAVSAGYGAPLGGSAGLELLYGLRADVQEGSERVKGLAGLLLQLHAGTGGGKLSLGAGASGSVRSDDFKGTAFAGLKASLVRTWRSSVGTDRHLTYLGPELELAAFRVDLTLGGLARLAGGAGPRVMFTWSLGVRL
jgi:hypothetical protein